MNNKTILIKAGFLSRILMITFILLLILTFVQFVILETSASLPIMNRSSNQSQAQTQISDRQERIQNSIRLFLPDGTIHLAYTDYRLPQNRRTMIYDLNDTLVWEGKENELPENYLKWAETFEYQLSIYNLELRNNIYPDTRRNIIVPVNDGMNLQSLWRYEDSGGYFKGFDTKGNSIGYIGSQGFTNEKSQAKSLGEPKGLMVWIPQQEDGSLMLFQTEHNIYQVDFAKKSVELVFQLPDDKITNIKINGWLDVAKEIDDDFYIDKQIYRSMILCTTENDSAYVILRDPQETIKINLPQDWTMLKGNTFVTATRDKIYLDAIDTSVNPPKEILESTDQNIIAAWYDQQRNKPVEASDKLYSVDSSGNLELINKFEWASPSRIRMQSSNDPIVKLRLFLSKASPVAYDAFFRILFRYFRNQLIANEGLNEFVSGFIRFAPNNNPYSYFLSILLAGIVFTHAFSRRRNMISLIAWIIFVFLFSIVGLLVYFALNFTPVIKCHNCNKKRGLVTAECPHCGAKLSTAESDKLCIIEPI